MLRLPQGRSWSETDRGTGARQRLCHSEARLPFSCCDSLTDTSDLSWEEEELEEEEEEGDNDDDDEDDDDDNGDASLEEETPVKHIKRLVPQKQTSVAKVRGGPPRLLRNLGPAS